MRGQRAWAGLVLAGLLLVGCGDDDDEASVENLGSESAATTSSTGSTGTTGGSEGGCHVEDGVSTKGEEQALTLNEFTIVVPPAEEPAPAGIVTFVAENTGEEPHELVIVKGDDPAALPVDEETGEMKEDELEEGALIGEIEPFGSGETCEGNFALETGKYVLLCNVVETEASGEIEAHFKEGMFTTFEVA